MASSKAQTLHADQSRPNEKKRWGTGARGRGNAANSMCKAEAKFDTQSALLTRGGGGMSFYHPAPSPSTTAEPQTNVPVSGSVAALEQAKQGAHPRNSRSLDSLKRQLYWSRGSKAQVGAAGDVQHVCRELRRVSHGRRPSQSDPVACA